MHAELNIVSFEHLDISCGIEGESLICFMCFWFFPGANILNDKPMDSNRRVSMKNTIPVFFMILSFGVSAFSDTIHIPSERPTIQAGIDAGSRLIRDGVDWPQWYHNGSRSDMGAYGGPGNAAWLP